MKKQKKVLTRCEAAELIGVSTETIRRWQHSGKLPVHHFINGRARYLQSDLDKIIMPGTLK